MSSQRFIQTVEKISVGAGKASSCLIIALMAVVCIEVVKRYALNAPTAWIFDISNMLYGAFFMMCGAYALARDAHVRGDFIYGSLRPRIQAGLDLALYLLFFMPGIVALCYAGWEFAATSWAINEHSSVTVDGPPVYPLKAVIPIAGALVLLQGLGEIVRCVMCLRSGEWPARGEDVKEIDVVKDQLAGATEAEREAVVQGMHDIDEAAHRRFGGGNKPDGDGA